VEVTALVVAVIAVLVAGAATRYTYSTAKEARLSRLHAQVPQLEAMVVVGGREGRLELALVGPVDLDDAVVEITQGGWLTFSPRQDGVALGGPLPVRRARTVGPLLVGGAPACWRVVLDDDRSEAAMLRIFCRAGKDSWTVAKLVSPA
jgi:hypothetical protein